jgi:hypothetical protein
MSRSRKYFMIINILSVLGLVQVTRALAAEPPILAASGFPSRRTYDTTSPTWASDLAGGKIWFKNDSPRYEWTQIFNPSDEYDTDLAQVSGVCLDPGISKADIPFTHPFGFDWECLVAPDPSYTWMLAPANSGVANGQENKEYADATQEAHSLGLSVPGVLGVETDQDLIPEPYRAQPGDRVAIWGRWIVDTGHGDFHTEIHPPLLIATARESNPGESIYSTVLGRPYLVSQEFGDGALRDHMLKEAGKVFGFSSTRLEAHATFKPKPFAGQPYMRYRVGLSSPRNAANDRVLVQYHFITRTGVSVFLYGAENNGVRIVVRMDDATYTVPPKPRKQDWSWGIYDIAKLNADAGAVLIAMTFGSIAVGDLYAGVVFGRGILADRYAAPVAISDHDSEMQTVYQDQIDKDFIVYPAGSGRPRPLAASTIDDNQPFPVYGWLSLVWVRHPG